MKTLLTKKELLSAVSGRAIGAGKCVFTNVTTDSRSVEKDSLFVPLVGEFQNGHKYIPQAIEKGATVIFVNNSEVAENVEIYENLALCNKAVLFVAVENTLHALQDAAEAYVEKFPDLIKVSITGSCGKTTTKEMMVSVAKQHFGEEFVVHTKGNFNSETGLPLSVFNIRENHKIGIFEMGMNRVEEIGEISKVLKSKYGIITNVGTAHIGILGSRENIAAEKRKSLRYVPCDGAAFVPAEDDFADFCTENVNGKIVKFGKSVSVEEGGIQFVKDNGLLGTTFKIDGLTVNLPLSGEYNYQNALGVIACAKELEISAEEIKKGLENMPKVSGRMEVRKVILKNNSEIVLINDCYNANPDSMSKALTLVKELTDVNQKIFVLGDMKELGDSAIEAHKSIGKILNEINPDKAFVVGPDMKSCVEVLDEKTSVKTVYFEQKDNSVYESIAKEICDFCKDNDVILLKGSHSMALESVIPLISKTGGNE